MAHFCPGGRWFVGAEEAVNTLVSDNCKDRQERHSIKNSISEYTKNTQMNIFQKDPESLVLEVVVQKHSQWQEGRKKEWHSWFKNSHNFAFNF